MKSLLLTALFSLPTARGRAAQDQDAARTGRAAQEIERLTAWPTLDAETKSTVALDVERLRKARTPEMATQARAALEQVGAGAAPELLAKLGKEQDAEARARVEAALSAITGAAHTRLLAREFAHKDRVVRVFALERVALFPDVQVRPLAEAALARARADAAKQKGDARELLAAALATTSAGSIEGLAELFVAARDSWGERGTVLRAALEAVRGPEASERIGAHLGGDRRATVAALNMLAGCGSIKEALPRIKLLLDHEDNAIRVAAINACRGIVDGEPPIERLPVFEAIELAKKWKSRI
jgi:hypothetical protein